MGINSILLLLLNYMTFKKASNQDYEDLKIFISASKVFKGNKKKMYTKINKFKNNEKHK
jgi:hypothetical protein